MYTGSSQTVAWQNIFCHEFNFRKSSQILHKLYNAKMDGMFVELVCQLDFWIFWEPLFTSVSLCFKYTKNSTFFL